MAIHAPTWATPDRRNPAYFPRNCALAEPRRAVRLGREACTLRALRALVGCAARKAFVARLEAISGGKPWNGPRGADSSEPRSRYRQSRRAARKHFVRRPAWARCRALVLNLLNFAARARPPPALGSAFVPTGARPRAVGNGTHAGTFLPPGNGGRNFIGCEKSGLTRNGEAGRTSSRMQGGSVPRDS